MKSFPLPLLAIAATVSFGLQSAQANPILVYKALDSSTPVYTLHNATYPLYVQTAKYNFTSFVLRDLGELRQATVSYGVVGKRKVFNVTLTTAGDWSTLKTESYASNLRMYSYPLTAAKTTSGSIQFELRGTAPSGDNSTFDNAATYFLKGLEKHFILPKSDWEVDAPLTLVGSGAFWDVSYYEEQPTNLKDFSGTMVTTALISTSYGLSVPFSDLVNDETQPTLSGQNPGTLPYAAAYMAQYLTKAGYQNP